MGGVDQVLVGGARRFQAGVDLVEVVAVIAVVVVVGAVQHDRGDPDRGETEGLDVVQLLDQPLEVPAEHRVVVGGVPGLHVLAAAPVVRAVAVVEAGGEHEVDRVLARVAAQRRGSGRGRGPGARGGDGRGGGGGEVPGGVHRLDRVGVGGALLQAGFGEDRGGDGRDDGALGAARAGDLVAGHSPVVGGGVPGHDGGHVGGGGPQVRGHGGRGRVGDDGGARIGGVRGDGGVLHRGQAGAEGVVPAVVVVPGAVAVVEGGGESGGRAERDRLLHPARAGRVHAGAGGGGPGAAGRGPVQVDGRPADRRRRVVDGGARTGPRAGARVRGARVAVGHDPVLDGDDPGAQGVVLAPVVVPGPLAVVEGRLEAAAPRLTVFFTQSVQAASIPVPGTVVQLPPSGAQCRLYAAQLRVLV